MKKIISVLILFIIFLIIGFIFQATMSDQAINLWLLEINLFGYYIKLVFLLFMSIIISLSLMFILSIFIFVNRKKLERKEKMDKKYLPLYQSILMNYLRDMSYSKDNIEQKKNYIKELKEISKGNYKKQLLINQFCDLNINLSDLNSKRLEDLYYKLKLHKKTYAKVHSLKWHKKIKGFKELYSMDMTEKNHILHKYINSRNDLVRMEAQIALVDLSKEDPNVDAFDFLHKLDIPFSLWEQITLYNLLISRNIDVPDFTEWLFSINDTVVMFCLRMIREYKQINACKEVQKLVYHENTDVKKLAIQVLGDLKYDESVKRLKHIYKNENFENRIEIIKAIGKMKNPKYIQFLQMVIDKEDSANLQIEATRAIRETGREGNKALNKMLSSDYKDYNIIIKHIKDRRI
jgi:hypothetical protein